jgi:competence protein ComEC
MINVGQGDSFIIRDKNNILAVDSYSSNINYIKSAGIDHIDVLCLTHSDNDHISSALDLVSDIKVDCLVLNYYENSDEIKRIEQKVKKVIRVKKGDNFSFGKNNCHVIGPKNKYKEVNNNSLVFITTVGSKRILFTGDMEKEEEEDIFDKKIFVDIIKIPHHGSDTSMSNNVIKNVSFNTCLISCGKFNKYNHPSSLTLDKLKNKNVYISYNTGSITFDLNSNIIIKKRDFRFYLNCLDCLTKEIY